MKLILKWTKVVQAVVLAAVGVSKPGVAVTPPDTIETLSWEKATSADTPEALQQFISQFPQSDRLDDAFDLLVQGEAEKTRSLGGGVAREVQLAQVGLLAPEQLELFLSRLAPEQLEQFEPAAGEQIAEVEPDY